ncbi:SigE family RNA polymerase sigma factor [Nocardioides maradonensis]
MRRTHEAEYEDFVRGHRAELLATARHLTGDHHLAEDLVQTMLTKLYLAWPRARQTNTGGYARRVLVNCFVDHRRRPWVRREQSAVTMPAHATSPAPDAGDAIDPELSGALLELPPRMRAAVVLRHVEDLSVEETARALGCSTGNVKSQTARGLDKLRDLLATTPERNHR